MRALRLGLDGRDVGGCAAGLPSSVTDIAGSADLYTYR
jgi:hypothetical protein